MRKRWLLLSIAYNMETLFVGEYIYYGNRQHGQYFLQDLEEVES